ncbi:hypothetical protein GCM10020358_35870 [Amorphoplanes nipponensis]
MCSSTACSCRAGTSRLKVSRCSPSGAANRVDASVSGVRQACIVHHRVTAAKPASTNETTIITAAAKAVAFRNAAGPIPPAGKH